MMVAELQRFTLGALLGVAVGLGLFTFVHARGASYLTNDPSACVQAVMIQPRYTMIG